MTNTRRKGSALCRSHESGQALVEYGLILLLVSVVTLGSLVLLGPKVGGVFSQIHDGLRGAILDEGDKEVTRTPTPETVTGTPSPSPSATQGRPREEPTPTATVGDLRPRMPTATPTATPVPTMTPTGDCVAFHFDGRFYARQWAYGSTLYQMVYGWGWVRDTTPLGRSDSLISPRQTYVRLQPTTGYWWRQVVGNPQGSKWVATPLKLSIYNYRWRRLFEGTLTTEQVAQLWKKIEAGEATTLELANFNVNNSIDSKVLDGLSQDDTGRLQLSFQSFSRSTISGYFYASMEGNLKANACP